MIPSPSTDHDFLDVTAPLHTEEDEGEEQEEEDEEEEEEEEEDSKSSFNCNNFKMI